MIIGYKEKKYLLYIFLSFINYSLMDIRAALLEEHSKQQALKIATYVGKDKKRFENLMHLFLHDEYRVGQRAAWVINMISEKNMQLVEPYMGQMVTRMGEPGVPVAVKRNVVRMLQNIELPEELHAPVMNTCFELLADPQETVAVRCFSMTVLDNLSKIYPDIRQELVTIIEDQLEHEPTAGFRSRAKKILTRKSR